MLLCSDSDSITSLAVILFVYEVSSISFFSIFIFTINRGPIILWLISSMLNHFSIALCLVTITIGKALNFVYDSLMFLLLVVMVNLEEFLVFMISALAVLESNLHYVSLEALLLHDHFICLFSLEGIYSSPILHILIFFPIVSFSFLHLSYLPISFSAIPLLSFQSIRFLQTYGNSLSDEPSETELSVLFIFYFSTSTIYIFYHALKFLQDWKYSFSQGLSFVDRLQQSGWVQG